MTGQQTPDEQREVLTGVFIRRRQLLYDATKNPVHAWAAFRLAYHYHVAIPDWVLAFLNDTGRRIQRDEPEPKRRGPSAAKRASTEERNRAIVDMVFSWKRERDGTLDEITFGKVGEEFGLSPATVSRIYYDAIVVSKPRRR